MSIIPACEAAAEDSNLLLPIRLITHPDGEDGNWQTNTISAPSHTVTTDGVSWPTGEFQDVQV